jgi:hypothetical protein
MKISLGHNYYHPDVQVIILYIVLAFSAIFCLVSIIVIRLEDELDVDLIWAQLLSSRCAGNHFMVLAFSAVFCLVSIMIWLEYKLDEDLIWAQLLSSRCAGT